MGKAKIKDDFFGDPKIPESYLIYYIYYTELIRMLSKLRSGTCGYMCWWTKKTIKSSRNVTAGGLVFRTPFLLRRCWFGRCHDPLAANTSPMLCWHIGATFERILFLFLKIWGILGRRSLKHNHYRKSKCRNYYTEASDTVLCTNSNEIKKLSKNTVKK